jgi:hypothetical protein
MLSSSQYGFRKDRGTRNCLALLTTDIQTSFKMKQQIVAAFIDLSGAYDNVLIDIICNILIDKELPSKFVRFLARLLWRKVLLFFAGAREYMTLVGYKSLPRGSVLIHFLYNVIGSCADRFVLDLIGCGFLQYADDLVVYVSHRLIEVTLGLAQTVCLGVFFSSMGLTISFSKSKVMLFFRKHERPPILMRIRSHVLPQTTTFKYLGVFFDCVLRWSAQTKYVKRRCLQRINLLKSVTGVSSILYSSAI